jgi:hypothetical protein
MEATNGEPRRRRTRRNGPGYVLLVGGPFHGERISGYILHGRLALATGEYVYVLDGNPKTLYWSEYPVVVEPARGKAGE